MSMIAWQVRRPFLAAIAAAVLVPIATAHAQGERDWPARPGAARVMWLDNQRHIDFRWGNDVMFPPITDKYFTNFMAFGISPVLERLLARAWPRAAAKLDAQVSWWMITPEYPRELAPWYGPIVFELSSRIRLRASERFAVDVKPGFGAGPDLPVQTGFMQNWFHDNIVPGADFEWPDQPLSSRVVAYVDSELEARWRVASRVDVKPFAIGRLGTLEDLVTLGAAVELSSPDRYAFGLFVARDFLHTRLYGPSPDKTTASRVRLGGHIEARVCRNVALGFWFDVREVHLSTRLGVDRQTLGQFAVKVFVDE